jgi:IS5 family transposase
MIIYDPIIDKLDTKPLIEKLDQTNKYIILAKSINWFKIELEFQKFYNPYIGARPLPIRLMVGLLLLKYMDNLSDEKVCERWKTDHYYQAFTGRRAVIDDLPCDPSTLSVFRKRIGIEGASIINQQSVEIFGHKFVNKFYEELIIDSTVQEKYTAFPTDIKLACDVITRIWKICDANHIKLRNKHKGEVFNLKKQAAFNKSNKRNEIKTQVLGKLRNIGLKLLNEMSRKLNNAYTTSEDYIQQYNNYYKALTQQKNDTNKIYSIFEPQISCIAKGKAHVQYEFGTKVSIIVHRSGIICGIESLDTNMHDSKTIQSSIDGISSHYGIHPQTVIADSGYKGRKYYGNTTIITPIKDLEKLDAKVRKDHVKKMNARSTIEQIISHLKNDFRLGRNELRGVLGDKINPLFAAAAHNFSLFVRTAKNKIKNKLKALKLHPNLLFNTNRILNT